MSQLERFLNAQDSPYAGFETALAEMRAGGKRGHWIWYVFPQLAGLGTSPDARMFAIDGAEEAREFLRDPVLRSRLLDIAAVVADQLKHGRPLRLLMGSDIDARKVVSSLTLFGQIAKELDDAEPGGAYESVATVADAVLALAASQGYRRCAYTLESLRSPS